MNKNFNISDSALDINFIFYNILKRLIKLSNSQISNALIEIAKCDTPNLTVLRNALNNKISENDTDIFALFEHRGDFVKLLEFSLQLLQVKPVLLEQAKLIAEGRLITEHSKVTNKLSIAFDTLSLGRPYYVRVGGALLSLLWFEKTESSVESISNIIGGLELAKRIRNNYDLLRKNGLEANQIFMIIFNESINQSIKSTAGASYEERVNDVIISCGVSPHSILKAHDSKYTDMEYDHIFTYNGKKIGVSSKRTLRERYKQFLHYTKDIDVDILINMTLGVDLNEQKLDNISKYGIHTVVADEIYENQNYSFVKNNPLVSKSSGFDKFFLDKITE